MKNKKVVTLCLVEEVFDLESMEPKVDNENSRAGLGNLSRSPLNIKKEAYHKGKTKTPGSTFLQSALKLDLD